MERFKMVAPIEQINFETLHSELAAKSSLAHSSLALTALVAPVS